MTITFILPVSAQSNDVAAGLNNFTKIKTYTTGQFTDIDSSAWYADSVAQVYELGLMNGNSASTFNPNGNITQAEALTITARIHKIYNTGNDDFSEIKQEMLAMEPAILGWCNNDKNSPAYKEFYEAWYAPYAYYLYTRVEREVDGEYPAFPTLGDEPSYAPFIDTQNSLIRLRFIGAILYGSLPKSEYTQINIVDNGGIPDLSYANSERIYTMYRAGILTGNDSLGTFAPYSNITRAEVAAILTRMINPSLRKNITLKNAQGTSDVISVSSSNLTISETTTLYADVSYESEEYPNGISLNADYDSNIISIEWGEWFLDSIPLNIVPLKNGTTTIRISVIENPNEYQDITVTVNGFNTNMSTPADLTTLTIEGVGNEFVDKQFNTNKLHSATYSIENIYDNYVNIKVDLIVSCAEYAGSSNFIKIRYNLYNSNGVVVNTGTTIVEFTSTDTLYADGLAFYGLPANEYKLVFSDDLVTENPNGNQIVSKGQVKGQITWQYNKFIGTRGDNGAKVLIIPANDKVKTFDNHEAAMFLTGTYDSGIMVTKCDGYGNFDFGDVPAGKYIMLIVSQNTNSMERLLDENSWISDFKMYYGDSFSDEDLEKLILFVGYQKYDFDYITVEDGKIVTITHDFGYTAA